MRGILANVVLLLIFALIVRIILDWVQVPAGHPVGRLRSMLASVTDPLAACHSVGSYPRFAWARWPLTYR